MVDPMHSLTRLGLTLFPAVLASGAAAQEQATATDPSAEVLAIASDRGGDLDLYIGTPGGEWRPLVQDSGVQYAPSWSFDGAHVVYESNETGHWELFRVAADGSGKTRLTERDGYDGNASYSPDGLRIVFASTRDSVVEGNAGRDLWRMGANGEGRGRLTRNDMYEGGPRISPDGRRVAFCRQIQTPNGPDGEIFAMDLNGLNETRVTRVSGFDCMPDWSPDGSLIAFHRCQRGGCAIHVVRPDGTDERRVSPDSVPGQWPRWSPDGEWIAYTSTREDQTDIWAVRADGSETRRLTSSPARDEAAAWRPRPGPAR